MQQKIWNLDLSWYAIGNRNQEISIGNSSQNSRSPWSRPVERRFDGEQLRLGFLAASDEVVSTTTTSKWTSAMTSMFAVVSRGGSDFTSCSQLVGELHLNSESSRSPKCSRWEAGCGGEKICSGRAAGCGKLSAKSASTAYQIWWLWGERGTGEMKCLSEKNLSLRRERRLEKWDVCVEENLSGFIVGADLDLRGPAATWGALSSFEEVGGWGKEFEEQQLCCFNSVHCPLTSKQPFKNFQGFAASLRQPSHHARLILRPNPYVRDLHLLWNWRMLNNMLAISYIFYGQFIRLHSCKYDEIAGHNREAQ